MSQFTDDKIEHIEEDVDKIKKKPNMYISYIGPRGVSQLFKEVVNNSIDEFINPNSPGNKIEIIIDKEDNSVYVSDNGRGIPPEYMALTCTRLQAGSKFTREFSGKTAGENGRLCRVV
ncbi:MAG: ATP-binding protein [Herbinix sp.]|nr:ATP-binding protein [Herbinix sp.]